MASVWKTAGMGAAAGLAVPVAGLSGLAAAGFMLILVLAMVGVGPARLSQTSLWGLLTSELMLYLLISLAIFTLSFRFLARLQARCQALVAKLNAQQGLSFDAGHLLGYPAPAFVLTWKSFSISGKTSGQVRGDGPIPPYSKLPSDPAMERWLMNQFGLYYVGSLLTLVGYDPNFTVDDRRFWIRNIKG